MTIRFCESFDGLAVADLSKKWTSAWASTSQLDISTTYGRNGTKGLKAFWAGSGTSSATVLSQTLDNQSTWFTALAFTTNNSLSGVSALIAYVDGGTTQLFLRLNTDRTLSIVRNTTVLATTSTVLTLAVTYHLEFRATFHGSTGSYDLWINGASALTGTGVNTIVSANAYASVVGFGLGLNFDSPSFYYDDIVIADGTNSQARLGDCRVCWSAPDGAGATTQFTPSAGSNYQCVDDATPNGDTDYVASSNVGDTDTYTLGNLPASAAAVKAVQFVTSARKDDAGTRTFNPVYRAGGTNYDGAAQSLVDTYTYYWEIKEQNPATSVPWTVSDVNALEVGQKVAS